MGWTILGKGAGRTYRQAYGYGLTTLAAAGAGSLEPPPAADAGQQQPAKETAKEAAAPGDLRMKRISRRLLGAGLLALFTAAYASPSAADSPILPGRLA